MLIVKYLMLAGWLVVGLTVSSFAVASNPPSIAIHGHTYSLTLTENIELNRQLGAQPMAAKHYQGRLASQPGSWVRMSNIAGRWQGVVVLSGEAYLVNVAADHSFDDHSVGSQQKLAEVGVTLDAQPVSSFQPVACGSGHPTHAKALINPNVHSALEVPSEVAFSSLCETNVNGVCLLAEVEFAFDELFQDEFGVNARAEAESLINMVEGFYRNDFNIIFDTITLELLDGDVFDATTDSGDFLDDIQLKKRNNQLPFVKNNRALLHVVTGRDFDEDTAGVAFLDALCNNFGFGAGTSQLLRRFNNTPNLPLTALVVAHELGHNFGADHDGENSGAACSDSGFIMAPSVSSAATGFSSCSVNTIEAAISALNAPELCFNFPIDIGITGSVSNPSEVEAGNEVTLQYDITALRAFREIVSIDVTGSVPAGEGRINSAEVDGLACTVAGDGLSYQCTVDSPQQSSVLQIRVVANVNDATFTQQVGTVGGNDIVDINLGNEQWQSTLLLVAVAEVPDAASNVIASQGGGTEVDLIWVDNSDNESGFRIERRTGSDAFSEQGSVSPNGTGFNDTTTVAGVEYDYRVIAFNEAGDAEASNIASITPQDVVPSAAGGVVVSQGDDTQVVVTWSDTSDNESGFRIERRIDTGNFIELDTVNSNTTTFTDTTSSGGISYSYRVIAFNDVGDSTVSNIASITPSEPVPPPEPTPAPPAPTPPLPAPSGGGGGSVSWPLLTVMMSLLWFRRRVGREELL